MPTNLAENQPGGTVRAQSRMTQPPEMRTKDYIYGVEKVDGNDAWALFEACDAGDIASGQGAAQEGSATGQRAILVPVSDSHGRARGASADRQAAARRRCRPGPIARAPTIPGTSCCCGARERGYRQIAALLRSAMVKRFRYSPRFEVLKEAIIARSARRINAVLREQPQLIRESDALGNNALHWSVMTRQLGLIKQFVDLGTPIDAECADGNTPVLLAVHGSDYWYRATRGSSHPSLRNAWVMVGSLLAQGSAVHDLRRRGHRRPGASRTTPAKRCRSCQATRFGPCQSAGVRGS